MGQLTLESVHLGTRGDEQWQALQTQGTPWAQARGSQVQARGWGQVRGGGAARSKSTGPSPPWDLADGEAALASQRIGRLDQRRRDPQAGTKGLYLADWFLTSSFLPGRSNWVTSQEQNHTLS